MSHTGCVTFKPHFCGWSHVVYDFSDKVNLWVIRHIFCYSCERP